LGELIINNIGSKGFNWYNIEFYRQNYIFIEEDDLIIEPGNYDIELTEADNNNSITNFFKSDS